MIRAEYNDEVKRLRHIVNDSNDILDSILEREKAETGIKTMKRGYNRVFGYYLEVTRSQSSLVPDRYIRKQTLTGAERYITEELKNTEAEILGASEKLNNLEYEYFQVDMHDADRQFGENPEERVGDSAARFSPVARGDGGEAELCQT